MTIDPKSLDLLEKAVDLTIVAAEKAFCPTGPGGGVDPTCGRGGGRGGRAGGKKPPKKPSGGGGKEKSDAPVDSMSSHMKDGKWSKERQALHKKIIDEHFAGKTPVKEPVAVVLGGGPASGKSSIIKSGQVKIDPNTVTIDSDAIKAKLPEYQKMTKAGDMKAASFVHEESSYLAKQIQARGSKGSYNTLLDGTGNSSYDKLKGKVDKMRAAGQKVIGHYVSVPTEMALARNEARAKKTGRLPPPAMVRACHASVSKIMGKAIKEGLFDSVDLYDTSDGVVKVAEASGTSHKILNQRLWKSFLAKADEK